MSASSLGRSAGLLLLAPGLNPFAEGTENESLWDRAWRKAVGEVLMLRDQERRRKVSSECNAEGDFALVKTPNFRNI